MTDAKVTFLTLNLPYAQDFSSLISLTLKANRRNASGDPLPQKGVIRMTNECFPLICSASHKPDTNL